MTIKTLKQVGGTEVMAQATVAYAQTIVDGHCPGRWGVLGRNSEAHYMEDESGKLVAILAFFVDDLTDGWVEFGWVHPDHRRKGLYQQLWDSVCAELRSRGVLRMSGSVDPRNRAAIAAALKQGRLHTRSTFSMELQK